MEQLGIEPTLLLAQIVNFSIIVFVLSKLLYKPILSMLEKRKKEIAEGLTLTETMKEAQEKAEEKHQKMLDDARKEVKKMLDEAKKQGEETKKDIVARAHQEAGDIVEKGKHEAERLGEEMEKHTRKQAVELAVAMAKRLLADMRQEDAHALIQKHVKMLDAVQLT